MKLVTISWRMIFAFCAERVGVCAGSRQRPGEEDHCQRPEAKSPAKPAKHGCQSRDARREDETRAAKTTAKAEDPRRED